MAGWAWPSVEQNDRVITFGTSGSGKTECMKRLLLTQYNAIVVDTKLNEDWSIVGPTVEGHDIYRCKGGRFHWRTPNSFVVDDDEQERFLRWSYDAGGRVIYVDELLDLAPRAASFPAGLKLLATRGRSQGVGLWTTTQRPYDIPLFAFSEARHIFVFSLNLERDKKRVEEVTEQRINWDAIDIDNHGFFYIDARRKVAGPFVLDLS